MSESAPVFRRYLSPAFTRALHNLVGDETGQWWRDVLAHPDLKLAVRTDAIDVYHRGASIFHIAPGRDGRVVPRSHFKYLMRRRQAHAFIDKDGSTFVYDPGETYWSTYEKGKTLDEMVAASRRFAGNEKSRLHPLIMHPSVIDLEIAFHSAANDELESLDNDDATLDDDAEVANDTAAKRQQDRLDVAALEDRSESIWVVFHEAKHFTNKELRARASVPPPVSEQIARYRRSIIKNAAQIAGSYREVCVALRELKEMRIKADPTGSVGEKRLHPLIERAAEGEELHVDCEPRLIVFGFDDDQKKGSTWMRHRQSLEEAKLKVYAIGKPDKNAAASAFSGRGS